MGMGGDFPPGPIGFVLADEWPVSPHGSALCWAQPPRAPCLVRGSSVLPGPFGDLLRRRGKMAARLAQDLIDAWPASSGYDASAGEAIQVNGVR